MSPPVCCDLLAIDVIVMLSDEYKNIELVCVDHVMYGIKYRKISYAYEIL